MISISSSSMSSVVSALFSKLDTSKKGYLSESDLKSAFSNVSASKDSADKLFKKLDSNSDGKLTQEEFSTGLQKLASQLDSQFFQSKMHRDLPPPPPPGGGKDTGLTKDQLKEIAATTSDSKLADVFSKLASNFTAADTNGDGKVTSDEALAYQQSHASTASSSGSASTSTDSANNDVSMLLNILKLAQTYGVFGTDSSKQGSNTSSLLSVA